MNNVVLIGRLTRDVELRYTQSGMAYAKGTLAVDKELSKEKRAEMENNNKPTADFIKFTSWGSQAEALANFTNKGIKLAMEGYLQTGSYEKDGEKHYTCEVVTKKVEFIEWKDTKK